MCVQGEAKFGALLSGLMGGVCVLVSKLPMWKGKAAAKAAKAKKQVSDRKLRSSLADDAVAEDSYVLDMSKPAAESLGYRQPAYYKHAIRAGENRLAVHFDQLDAPTLFTQDPEASLRARAKWKLTSSKLIVPVEELTSEEKAVRQATSTINFLSRQASQKKPGASGFGAVLGTSPASIAPAPPTGAAEEQTPRDSSPVAAFVAGVDDAPEAAPAATDGDGMELTPATAAAPV